MMDVELELAKMLYDSIMGDLNDPSEAFDLLGQLGYTSENGDWIYGDD